MTTIQKTETIQIENYLYEIGEPLEHSFESVLAIEAVGQLVIARKLDDKTGELAMMKQPSNFIGYPTRPDEASFKANPAMKKAYYDEYMEYLAKVKQDKTEAKPCVYVPAYIGTVRAIGNSAYFSLSHQYTPKPTIHIPYEVQSSGSYRTQLAQIVE